MMESGKILRVPAVEIVLRLAVHGLAWSRSWPGGDKIRVFGLDRGARVSCRLEFAIKQESTRHRLFLVSSFSEISLEIKAAIDDGAIMFARRDYNQGLSSKQKVFRILGMNADRSSGCT